MAELSAEKRRWKGFKKWLAPWIDRLDPLIALIAGAAAGIAGVFGFISGDTLAAATLLVLSVVGLALVRERSLRQAAKHQLDDIETQLSRTQHSVETIQSGDPFRMLLSEITWDIVETDGSLANVTVRRRIRFSQNNVFAIYDFSGGDGTRDETYSLGEKIHEFNSEGQMISIIAFDRFFSRNDEIDFVVNRVTRDAFLSRSEGVVIVAKEKAVRTLMKVHWPVDRSPTHVRFIKTSASGIRQAAVEQAVKKEDGRPTCEVELLEPEVGGRFAIEWDW
jgi:membrane protein implicated in regulation of membrane protease activity